MQVFDIWVTFFLEEFGFFDERNCGFLVDQGVGDLHGAQ